jgi:hypothetical protein
MGQWGNAIDRLSNHSMAITDLQSPIADVI